MLETVIKAKAPKNVAMVQMRAIDRITEPAREEKK
jgi:hypothetical protein